MRREILITYKIVFEIKDFLAKAKERERMVLEPLRQDIEQLNRERRDNWSAG